MLPSLQLQMRNIIVNNSSAIMNDSGVVNSYPAMRGVITSIGYYMCESVAAVAIASTIETLTGKSAWAKMYKKMSGKNVGIPAQHTSIVGDFSPILRYRSVVDHIDVPGLSGVYTYLKLKGRLPVTTTTIFIDDMYVNIDHESAVSIISFPDSQSTIVLSPIASSKAVVKDEFFEEDYPVVLNRDWVLKNISEALFKQYTGQEPVKGEPKKFLFIETLYEPLGVDEETGRKVLPEDSQIRKLAHLTTNKKLIALDEHYSVRFRSVDTDPWSNHDHSLQHYHKDGLSSVPVIDAVLLNDQPVTDWYLNPFLVQDIKDKVLYFMDELITNFADDVNKHP